VEYFYIIKYFLIILQKSIEPDSTISDILAQDKMNEYLDECLDMEAILDEKIETESEMITDYIQVK